MPAPALRTLLLAATACAVAMTFELSLSDEAEGAGVPAVLAVAAACLPILLVGRRPWLAVALVMAGVFVMLEVCKVSETIALPSMTVGFFVCQRAGRGTSLVLGGVFTVVVVVCLVVYSPHGLLDFETPKNLLYVAVPILAGNMVRDRRDLVASLVARAETAERTRDEEALRRVEQERVRIARDVHDVVAHSMVAINVQAGVAAHLLDRDPGQAHRALREIKRVSGDALTDLRATLGVLRDDEEAAPTAPAQGFAALGELTEGLRAAGIDVELAVNGDGRLVPSAVDAAGYRIVQEALTNVLRHAHATRAGVIVDVGAHAVEIEVVDDGGSPGIANGSAGTGNGLRGMRERAAAVGGRVEAGARPEGGWRVHARLPIPAGPSAA